MYISYLCITFENLKAYDIVSICFNVEFNSMAKIEDHYRMYKVLKL